MRYSLNVVALWMGLTLPTIVHLVGATVQPPLEVNEANDKYTSPISDQSLLGGLSGLFDRQSNCYAPNNYCPLYNKCCASNAYGCCPNGCTPVKPNECCTNGKYCENQEECCNSGCMPAGSQCCRSGGYCPSPFICVIYQGQAGCCTDLSCRVYLSSGITRTQTAAATAPAVTQGTSIRITSAFTATRYYTYYTTYYWSYWYYFYTIYYSPVTYTTRVSTTVYRTTSLTVSATDTYAAVAAMESVSSILPTPTNAGMSIPATPTSGAVVYGSCSSTSTSTITNTDGSTARITVPVCSTTTADGRGVYSAGSGASQAASGSSGSSSAGGGPLAAASSIRGESLSVILLITLPILIGSLMIAL